MRNIIEGYVIILLLWLLVLLSVAFTTINMDVTAAKKIHNNIISEIENTDGAILNDNKFVYDEENNLYIYESKASNNAYTYTVTVAKEDIGSEVIQTGQTVIYNTVYKVNMYFDYYVPLFGKQNYTSGRYAK